MIDYSKLYGAEEDANAPVTSFSFLDFRSLYWQPLSRVWNSNDFLDQNEFKEHSPFCTLYAAMYSFVHWFGFAPAKTRRLAALKYMLDRSIILDTDKKKWGQPMKTAEAFVEFFNDNQFKIDGKYYKAKISFFNSGSYTERLLMTFGRHGFVTWFTITDWFIADRVGDATLDQQIHGGDKHGWHAIFETIRKPNQLLVMNNYPNRDDNNFWIKWKDSIDKRYDKKYHYAYSALITYRAE